MRLPSLEMNLKTWKDRKQFFGHLVVPMDGVPYLYSYFTLKRMVEIERKRLIETKRDS